MSLKSLIFKTCPKTGKIRGIRTDKVWQKIIFPIIGILSLIWVIVRVVPKPSRAVYPCQQAAIPFAAWFITWITASAASVMFIKKAKTFFRRKQFIVAASMVLVSVGFYLAVQLINSNTANANVQIDPNVLQPMADKPNQPIGTAKGIFPGRVTWIRDIAATPWDGTGNWWRDSTGINQGVVNKMISSSLKALTGASSDKKAWQKIFQYYNKTHNRGNNNYNEAESVVIKINLNNSTSQNDSDNNADASKQTILAVLDQLINNAGVPQNKITVIDAIRVIPDHIFNPCHDKYPGVIWVDKDGTNGRTKNVWFNDAFAYSVKNAGNTNIPVCIKNATYQVNLPVLKGHEYSGVTMSAKNNYGSIAARDHSKYLRVWQAEGPQYSMLVDLMGTKELDGKSIIFIMDGLFANRTNTQDNNQDRCAFTNLFKGEWCASIFMSLDEVAFESVGLDFLVSEFGPVLGRRLKTDKINPVNNCDNYLHEAALANNPPSGTSYKPDGVNLTSLGVHEHWNNPVEKKYSRNLHTGNGIELYQIPAISKVKGKQ
jgi:hypothetical protein